MLSSYPIYPGLEPIIFVIDVESEYSLISSFIILSFTNNLAKVSANFVLPTPVGPVNISE